MDLPIVIFTKVPSNIDPNATSCHGFAPAHSGAALNPWRAFFFPEGTRLPGSWSGLS